MQRIPFLAVARDREPRVRNRALNVRERTQHAADVVKLSEVAIREKKRSQLLSPAIRESLDLDEVEYEVSPQTEPRKDADEERRWHDDLIHALHHRYRRARPLLQMRCELPTSVV